VVAGGVRVGLTRQEAAAAAPRRRTRGWGRRGPGLVIVGLALLVMAATAASIGWLIASDDRRPQPTAYRLPATPHVPSNPAAITAADPGQLRPVSREDAEVQNAAIPIARVPVPAASMLTVPAGNLPNLMRAVQCMTTAIYYEAATEPIDGQRAVAQVVLNRVRHPSFPHTVCGVIYQGSGRRTGCQFSFTCDGSLARTPDPRLWRQARMVAVAALSGAVFPAVGWSTYYHADYVLPYWASTLTKLDVVGRHIFYRLPGGGGAPTAFSARYAGDEPDMLALMGAGAGGAPVVPPPTTVDGVPTTTGAVARPVLLPGVDGTTGAQGEAPAALRPTGPVVPTSQRWVIGGQGQQLDKSAVPADPKPDEAPPIKPKASPKPE
jgi:hypothetical protein